MIKLNNILLPSCMISCSILFSRDELLRMEELSVSSKPHLIHNSWLEIGKYSPENMFSSSCFREEGVERIISSSNYLVRWHSFIRLNSCSRQKNFQQALLIWQPAWPMWTEIHPLIVYKSFQADNAATI